MCRIKNGIDPQSGSGIPNVGLPLVVGGDLGAKLLKLSSLRFASWNLRTAASIISPDLML